MTRRMKLLFIGGIIISVLGTVLVVYLTPLKNLNLIEPHIRDVASRDIYARIQAHPENFVFIDVRPESAYAREHAVGSINIDLPKLYYERYNLPKQGKEIVLICRQGIAAGVAYGYLEHYGFLNLYRIEGGIEQWIAAGLPTETSRESIGTTE